MNNLNNINNNPDLHKKGTIIIVNGRSIETFEKKLTFEQIVQLAFNEYTPSESTVYTVTYSKNEHDKGMLTEGDVITVRKELVFNVTKLLDHSTDLQKLVEDGYELEIRGAFALVHHIPYVNQQAEVLYGTLVSPLSLSNNAAIKPETHVIYFIGEHPCDKMETSCLYHASRFNSRFGLGNHNKPLLF